MKRLQIEMIDGTAVAVNQPTEISFRDGSITIKAQQPGIVTLHDIDQSAVKRMAFEYDGTKYDISAANIVKLGQPAAAG